MRSALVVAHTGRAQIKRLASQVADQLQAGGFSVRMLADEALDCGQCDVEIADPRSAADGAEIVLVFGGDGTFLRAAEYARPSGVPMLGVNFGHVGFLAEAEPDDLDDVVRSVIDGRYQVEERITVDVAVLLDGAPMATGWALNEASVEKSVRERILEVEVAVDARPLLRFGCDGVLCATPTGSTAYAFSAGGPVMWPTVDALLVVPNAAHAVFSRPIVVSPDSTVDICLTGVDQPAVLGCDGRRSIDVPSGGVVRVRRGELPVRIVRFPHWNFAERLVTKFQIPVRSFRDPVVTPTR